MVLPPCCPRPCRNRGTCRRQKVRIWAPMRGQAQDVTSTHRARAHTPFLFTSFFFSPFSVAEVASVVAAAAPSSLKVDGPGCSSSMTTIVALASEAATVAASVAVSGSMALERER